MTKFSPLGILTENTISEQNLQTEPPGSPWVINSHALMSAITPIGYIRITFSLLPGW